MMAKRAATWTENLSLESYEETKPSWNSVGFAY